MLSFLHRLRARAILVALALACPLRSPRAQDHPASAAASTAKHMLFRVRAADGAGATVFLLGSVHLLSADAAQLPPAIDSAFDQAQSVVFETSLDSLTDRAMDLLARAQYRNGATLRSSLSPAALPKLDTLLAAYGLTLDQVDRFKPWFISALLSQRVLQQAHFQPQYGVDEQLNARAAAAGKARGALESVDFQLGLFDSLSPADQEAMLLESDPPAQAARELMTLKNAWLAGNVAALDSIFAKSEAESPSLYDALVRDRNRAWLPKIEAMLRGRGDVLVVVGAGHLVGTDGLVALLRSAGYRVEQR